MYNNRNFNQIFNRGFGSIMEDLLQNKKIRADELVNEDKMHVPINIIENDTHYSLQVIAPGLKKEDIQLNLEKNILTISHEQKEEESAEVKNKILRNEYKFKSFKRSFTLNDKIDTSGIEAKYNDGILNITLPKKENTEPEPHSITIG